jgi:kinesin family protein 2/24
VRVENTYLREAEDGRLFVIDLAGSESAADSQFHDGSLIEETKLINKSLMNLKECIRHRALSALNPDKYYHIPYRLSRLTLLLKDAFELESHRHCKTVVFACVSPSVADAAMTANTLNYTVPIRIGQVNREKVVPNPKNPANWGNEQLREWVATKSRGAVDPEVLCPFESGMQLLRLPETDFILRVMAASNHKMGEKKAKVFYTSLWKLLVDARTFERRKKLRAKDKEDKVLKWANELMEKEAEAKFEDEEKENAPFQ